jgi:hypothetical protein
VTSAAEAKIIKGSVGWQSLLSGFIAGIQDGNT